MVYGPISSSRQAKDVFEQNSCHVDAEYVSTLGESNKLAEHAAKICAMYLDGLKNGNGYHRVKVTREAGLEGYYPLFHVVESGTEKAEFDDWFGSNEDIARDAATILSQKSGKHFEAVMVERRYFRANVWTVRISNRNT